MVTSSWDHVLLLPLGLVPRWKGLQCQFRGDWSQRMASSTSESDSNTFAYEEMQYHFSYYFFSLTTDMNCFAQNPQVPAVKKHMDYRGAYGVRVLFFSFWLSVNSLLSPVIGYYEGRRPYANVGVHSYINTNSSQFNFERASVILFCR